MEWKGFWSGSQETLPCVSHRWWIREKRYRREGSLWTAWGDIAFPFWIVTLLMWLVHSLWQGWMVCLWRASLISVPLLSGPPRHGTCEMWLHLLTSPHWQLYPNSPEVCVVVPNLIYHPLPTWTPQAGPGSISRTGNSGVVKGKEEEGGLGPSSADRTHHAISPPCSSPEQRKNCQPSILVGASIFKELFPWNFPSSDLGKQSTPFPIPSNLCSPEKKW